MHSECAPPATEACPGARRAPRRRSRTATASARAPTPAPVSLSCDSSFSTIHLGAVYVAFNGSALCTELLVPGERSVVPSPTLDDGELFARLQALVGPSGASSRPARCSCATLPAPATGTAAAIHGGHVDRDSCDLLLVAPATDRPVT